MNARGRLAPSPTGDLHLGGAATFLVAWLEARSQDAPLILRMEDLDTPRVVPGSEARLIDDLRWLGLDWDEGPDVADDGPHGPYRQSARLARYEAALDRLAAAGATYPCDCSRAEIARVASAPHAGEEVRYPGTCRRAGLGGDARARDFRRPPAVRFAVPEGEERFVDGVHGEVVEDVAATVGDFVLRRGDGTFAYQLAVVVDDLAMEIGQVVRGADLLGSTARQRVLARALGGMPPSFLHAPLMVGANGERLAKRAQGVPVRDHREAPPEALLGKLAHALGLTDDDGPNTLPQLLARYDRRRLRRDPVQAPYG